MNIKMQDIKEITKEKPTEFHNYTHKEFLSVMLETKKTNPNSLGVTNTLMNDKLVLKLNKPSKWDVYFVMNVTTPTDKMLNKNFHPNIVIDNIDGNYICLHSSSDQKAFKNNAPYIIGTKTYYICLDRIYIYSHDFFKKYATQEINSMKINDKTIESIVKTDFKGVWNIYQCISSNKIKAYKKTS